MDRHVAALLAMTALISILRSCGASVLIKIPLGGGMRTMATLVDDGMVPNPVVPLVRMTHRGTVPPWPEDCCRPRWSVMIPTYNAGSDLERSLGSVLTQALDPAEMQIEVVDDCSTRDDPRATVERLGQGRVTFFRQPRNVGHSRNFNTCVARARGEFVHLLHADDWVGDGFYARMTQLFDSHTQLGAAFCRHAIIDPDATTQWISPLERDTPGVIEAWLERIAGEQRVQAPSIVVRRMVYEHLGGFDTRILSCGEDWEMWVRIAAAGYPVGFIPEVLAFYQDSTESLTKRAIRSGQNIKDLRLATRMVGDYLPRALRRGARRRALGHWAEFALRWARLSAARGVCRSALVQSREALLCERSARTLRQVAMVGWSCIASAQRRRARQDG